METITPQSASLAISELAKGPSLAEVFDYLDNRQPSLSRFSMESMQGNPSDEGIKALMMGWLSLRAFEIQSDGKLPVVSMESFRAAGKRNQDLLQNTTNLSLPDFMQVMSLETSGQPYLMEVIRKIVADMISKGPLNAKVVSSALKIYLTVKSVAEAIDSETN